MDSITAMRRAQARYDSAEEPCAESPIPPNAVDRALDYVRGARAAGAPESTVELLVEATPDLVVRAAAARALGVTLPAPPIPQALKWGGLDFDTEEMDGEIIALLSKLAPEGGSLRAMSITARAHEAHIAAREDANLARVRRANGADLEDSTPEERAMDEMVSCLSWLAEAQNALFEAHEALRRAERAAGGAR